MRFNENVIPDFNTTNLHFLTVLAQSNTAQQPWHLPHFAIQKTEINKEALVLVAFMRLPWHKPSNWLLSPRTEYSNVYHFGKANISQCLENLDSDQELAKEGS